MKNGCALLLVPILLCAGGARAQGLPGTTMHRVKAGTLDAAGWTKAEATQGAFTMNLPCLFNDFTVDDHSPGSAVAKAFTIGCLRPDQSRFSATRFQYREGGVAARAYFEKSVSPAAWPKGTIVRSRFQGFDAVDVTVDDGARCTFIRSVNASPDNLLVVVESPEAACNNALEVTARKVFGSLVVKPR